MALALEPMSLGLELPWQIDGQREQAFKSILKWVLIPLLILFVVVPFLPLVDSGNEEKEITTRTLVLLDPIVEQTPEAAIVEPEPIAPKPEPPAPATEKPAPVTQPKAMPPKAVAKPVEKVDMRESLAESQGLSGLSSQLNAVRNSVNLSSMRNKNLSDNTSGKVAKAERARLGQELATRSSGTVVSETVMAGEVTQLADHQSAVVEGLTMKGVPQSNQSAYLSSQTGRRDMESIRRTLEQAKGNIYAMYQQALIEHPGLTGEFTFELVIEPNGSVSKLTLLVSELDIADLETRILERIKSVDFGVMDVPPTVVEYRFVFLPS